jgi:serine/threonine protein kinase
MLALRQGLYIAEKYRLLALLGRGGMGEIWSAMDDATHSAVAIKFMQFGPGLGHDEYSVRFEREARLLSSIDHPHIVRFLDFGLTEGVPYLVMERLVGEDLAARLVRVGRLASEEVGDLVSGAASALERLHELGIIHRDIKPGNIYFAHEGDAASIKLLDFGVAKLIQGPEDSARAKAISELPMGTPLYMSPERIRGEVGDHRSDLWSLSIVLFEACTGRTPFGDTSNYLRQLYDVSRVPGLSSITLPLGFIQFFERALAFDPAARFQSARELYEAFIPLVKSLVLLEHSPLPVRQAPITEAGLDAFLGGSREAPPPPSLARSLSSAQLLERGTGSWTALAQGLPPKLAGHAPTIALFFHKLFTGFARMAPDVIRLEGPRFPEGGEQPFFAVFAAGEDQRLATQTFIGYVDPLERHLARLNHVARKVVIAVVDANELGSGVRSRIFDFQKKYGAIVLPVHVGELANALRDSSPRDFLIERLKDFHTPPDVFSRAERTVDRTRMFGMSALVNELTRLLQRGSSFVLLTGLPGSGKTSLLELARDGLGDTRFVRVRCIELVDRKVATVAGAVVKALTDKAPEGPADGADLGKWLSEAFVLATRKAQRKGERLILVLDDADFCIASFTDAGVAEQERQDARLFWAALAEQSSTGNCAVVVTSLAGSLLASTVIDGWANPLANQARVLRVEPLDAGDIHRLCTELGRQINISFSPKALAHISALSAGNVSVVLSLCGTAVRMRRQAGDVNPLSSVHVERADIQQAAKQLIHTGDDFRSSLLPWLGPVERKLLELVASQRPRTPAALRNALADPPEQCDAAFARLRHMRLIDSRGGRLELTIPLLALWVRHNFEPTATEADRRLNRRLRTVSLGVTTSLLLFGGYYLWSQPGEVEWTSPKCQGRIFFQSRAVPGREETLYLSRECDSPGDAEPVSLVARMGTFARLGTADSLMVLQGPGRSESIPADWRRLELPVLFRDVGRRRYEFDVHVGRATVATLVIGKDWVAELPGYMKALLALMGAFPTILGLLLSFHQDVASKVRRLFTDARTKAAPQTPPSG